MWTELKSLALQESGKRMLNKKQLKSKSLFILVSELVNGFTVNGINAQTPGRARRGRPSGRIEWIRWF